MKEIGERIRTIRTRRGLSCQELADMTGYSREMIDKWELGVRRLHADNLPPICAALYVSADFLLGIDGVEYMPVSSDIERVLNMIEGSRMFLDQAKKIIKGE